MMKNTGGHEILARDVLQNVEVWCDKCNDKLIVPSDYVDMSGPGGEQPMHELVPYRAVKYIVGYFYVNECPK